LFKIKPAQHAVCGEQIRNENFDQVFLIEFQMEPVETVYSYHQKSLSNNRRFAQEESGFLMNQFISLSLLRIKKKKSGKKRVTFADEKSPFLFASV
jgi:hypothetical protein